MRTNVGSGDGVTNASIRPDTSSTPTSPTATETIPRPCSASTCPRGRSPGEITDQPSRIPAPAARNTAVSSSNPCGSSRPSNSPPLPAGNIRPAITPTFAAFSKMMNGIGRPNTTDIAMHLAATQELFTQTCRANAAAGWSL